MNEIELSDEIELSEEQETQVDLLQRNNDYNWYAVITDTGAVELKHKTMLSSILDCGEPASDYGIVALIQCGLD